MPGEDVTLGCQSNGMINIGYQEIDRWPRLCLALIRVQLSYITMSVLLQRQHRHATISQSVKAFNHGQKEPKRKENREMGRYISSCRTSAHQTVSQIEESGDLAPPAPIRKACAPKA